MARRKPLAAKAAEQILNYIQVNKLSAGDKLPTEPELTELLGVGRGTVREAVGSLVSRNILEVRQGSGTFVSGKKGVVEDPLGLALVQEDEDQLALDMMEVRLMLEPEIAYLAAANATEEQAQAVLKQCALIEELIHNDKPYRKEDGKFHQMIAECCQNKILAKMIPMITTSISLNVDVTKDRYRGKTLIYHRKVAEAIANRDPQGARYNMITHLNVLREGIRESIKEKHNEKK